MSNIDDVICIIIQNLFNKVINTIKKSSLEILVLHPHQNKCDIFCLSSEELLTNRGYFPEKDNMGNIAIRYSIELNQFDMSDW